VNAWKEHEITKRALLLMTEVTIMGPTYRPIVIPMTATIETNNKSKINLNLTIFQGGFHQTSAASSSTMTLDKGIPL